MFVTDPERSPVPAGVHLQQAFGLSAAETRRNTVRTHLHRLFAKTETARRADLIRVLLSTRAPVRFACGLGCRARRVDEHDPAE